MAEDQDRCFNVKARPLLFPLGADRSRFIFGTGAVATSIGLVRRGVDKTTLLRWPRTGCSCGLTRQIPGVSLGSESPRVVSARQPCSWEETLKFHYPGTLAEAALSPLG